MKIPAPAARVIATQPVAVVGHPAIGGPFSTYRTDAAIPPLNFAAVEKVVSIVTAAAAALVRVGCRNVSRRMRSGPR
jgi:hypothetical protein